MWLTLWFFTLLVLNAIAFPSFRAPDEIAHFDRALGIAESPSTVAVRDRHVAQRVRGAARALGLTGAAGDVPPLRAAAADRRPLEAFRTADDVSTIRNQMTQHPPAYYLLAAVTLKTFEGFSPGWASAAADVLALRLLGVALVTLLPVLTITAAWRSGLDLPSSVAAGVCVTAVPMLAHIGASVNNDTLLIVLGGILTVQLTGVSRGTRRWWTVPGVIGLTAAVALLTKGFALIVLGWLPVAYAVTPRHWRGRLNDLCVALAVSCLGLAWWIRNLAIEGTVQPDHTSLPAAALGFSPDVGWWAGFAVRRLVQRFWVEPDIATDVTLFEPVAAVVLLALAVGGTVVAWHRREGGWAAVLAFPTVALGGLMTVGAWGLYARTGQPFGIHGRYLYPALPGLCVLAGTAVSALPSKWRWGAVATLFLAAAAYQFRVLTATLTFYWGSQRKGFSPDAVAAAQAWTPLSPGLLLVVAATMTVAVLALLALFIRRQLAPQGVASPVHKVLSDHF